MNRIKDFVEDDIKVKLKEDYLMDSTGGSEQGDKISIY